MFDTVLLAVDPNHPASWEKALPKAADIVRQSGGTLHLVVVVPDFGMTIVRDYFPENFEPEALKRAKADLDAFVAKNAPPGVKTEAHIAHGDTVEQILHMAEQTNADLIMLGAHKPDQIRTLLVGSNADRIVHRANTSVLVVR